QHDGELEQFARQLAEREGLTPQPDGSLVPPPPLLGGQRVDWPDLLRVVQALLGMLRNRREPMETRMRKCLALAQQCRMARLDQVKGERLTELLQIIQGSVEAEVPKDPASLPPPGWIGRVLFRQAVALYTRKDHGPSHGLARRGRGALLAAA